MTPPNFGALKPPENPRTVGEAMQTMEVREDDGALMGSRYATDENGRIKPVSPRPWHSYRGVRRNMARLFYRTFKAIAGALGATPRKIDEGKNRLFLYMANLRHELAARRAALEAEQEIAYLEAMKTRPA